MAAPWQLQVIGFGAGAFPVRVGNTTSVATAYTAATAQAVQVSPPVLPESQPEPSAEPTPDPRQLLGVSLDEASKLLQSVSSNVKLQDPLKKQEADKLIANLKDLIAELEAVYKQ